MSPVGALNNGIELLADETDPDMREKCLELLSDAPRPLRRALAETLAAKGKRGDAEIHEALIQVLGESDLPTRTSCYLALGKIAAPGAAAICCSSRR